MIHLHTKETAYQVRTEYVKHLERVVKMRDILLEGDSKLLTR